MHRRPVWFHLPFVVVGLFVVAIAGYNAVAALGVALPGLTTAPAASLVTCAVLATVGLLVAGQALWQMRRGREHNALVDRLRRHGRRVDAVVERVEPLSPTRNEDDELSWRITATVDDPALGGLRLFLSDALWDASPPARPGEVVGVFVDPEQPGSYLFDDPPRRSSTPVRRP